LTAAIYFHPEGYSTSGPKLMGRNAAGHSFLRGFLRHAKTDAFWVRVERPEHAREFAALAKAAGRTEPINAIGPTALASLAEAGAMYYPDPHIGRHAWQRGLFGHELWGLTGITHTTSSLESMDAIVDVLTAPVQPWDALICTSTAVRDNVLRLLQAQEEHLRARLGIARVVLPQLPVIPLGVHVSDFTFAPNERGDARRRLGVDENDAVVLFLGRLSFHAKAHPLAMYQALERAVRVLPAGRRAVLVECGWHANHSIARAYMHAALTACPNVHVVTLDGRKANERRTAWASADIFCSLSDNIQETFGIAPVEAMAAGLPVVLSDWNGYRDTARDGIDGFRIPTLMPQPGLGDDLATAYALGEETYDRYCGYTCMTVAVDVDATARAFERLFASAELRRQMGEAGRRRALETFDWAAIIPRYEELWGALAETRKAHAAERPKLADPWPARMDPYSAFAGYPTTALTTETRLALVESDAEGAVRRIEQYRCLAMVEFASRLLPTPDETKSLLAACANGPESAAALVTCLPAARRRIALRGLAWLIKMGILKVAV
jgi:alpha-maltose-1-phosphate synthase